MAKVFRFHDGGSLEDWQTSASYGQTAINAIKDPSGASARREITSIPSPFARIDLVKTAFENITNSSQLNGTTIFHKMVSDCFDVGEIFFNIDKLQDKVNIIAWDKNKDLEALLQSPNARHRLLGDTLKLYLEQDARAYNFNETEQIYLLNYKAGPRPINIIGGTSPASLFFTPANNLKYVNIPFGTDYVFDDSYQPLYKRDFYYQKFIYGLKKFIPDFSRKFRAVDNYLDASFEMLTAQQKEEINNYTTADFESDFEKLTAGSAGTPVEILGYPLRKKKEAAPKASGFIIGSAKYKGENPPLVLPVDAYAEKTLYTSDYWDRNNKADYIDNRPLKERTLPFDGKKYPYLTISDFLEPYIIRTIYPLQNKKFFDGSFTMASGEIAKGYLLPVKREYFDYFDVDKLTRGMPDGKKAIEIKQMVSGGVAVTLRVPIQDNKYITYERMYYPPANEYQIAEPELPRNRGAVIENQFGLTVYPFLKLAADSNNHYRIALFDRDIQEHNKHNSYSLQFFKNQDNIQAPHKALKQRSEKAVDNIASSYYVLEEGFDYIEIKNNWARGIIIPLFETPVQGTSQFTFAVDFGTTNTHIEYRKDNGNARPFEINREDIQIATLHDTANSETLKSINALRANKLLDVIPHEFVPEIIQKETEISFPQRTAISSKKGTDLSNTVYAFSDFNIPFLYEKHITPRNTDIKTNLKWSGIQTNDGLKVVEAYFENLLLLMRNKVLLNNGDLSLTKLIWLYPSSMTDARRNKIGQSWDKLFKKYFNSAPAPEKLSESVAPFYYFNKKEGIVAGENSVISIDIGGETTDTVIYINDRPELLTSFRFAANSIFGDYTGRSSSINGFVNKYSQIIEEKGLSNWFSFKDIEKSEDIISYLFSIEKSDRLKAEGKDFSFNSLLLNDHDFRIVFILFYSAVIYHIAMLMVAKNIKAPGCITLSGTGSKMVDLAEGNTKLTAIKELTELIFKKVYNLEKSINIDLKKVANPKEISCIGALLVDEKDISVNNVTTFSGTIDHPFSLKYNDITPNLEKQVADGYLEFLNFFFGLNNEFSFKNKLDINPAFLAKYKGFLEEKVLDNIKSGIKEKIKELQGNSNEEIEETLFFYPLKGGLNHLAHKIYSELNNSEA
ncbi:hypothetical protein AM493_01160 [Flavobacterium akiainvivens]|uniref:Ppx/GppA phosphatase domain-containing protein n=1 Tax=Flavobacterium akiainvivens TaxID=1202724 RepID=A0A0M8M8M0_9FLAO|nr:hypothetical protein [Flavobacterium akiainvivens]KOS04805.1 hypothetical protein AM493_01160 [Flavobacterium akiainvivens]SFQ43917.1 hypothetical protein SAMN05444144_104295 [Flavobacterium akiainvivens]